MSLEGKSRAELAREADQARAKLVRIVQQLDHRGHEVLDLRLQMQRHLRLLLIGGVVLIVGTSMSIGLAVRRAATYAERRKRARWPLLKEAWSSPERARRRDRGSFVAEAARSILLSLVTSAIASPGRRFLWDLLARRSRANA